MWPFMVFRARLSPSVRGGKAAGDPRTLAFAVFRADAPCCAASGFGRGIASRLRIRVSCAHLFVGIAFALSRFLSGPECRRSAC